MKKILSHLIRFVGIWIFMFFSYLTMKIAFNIVYFDWIDLRRAALIEIMVLPTGQSVVFWIIVQIVDYLKKRRARRVSKLKI